MRIRPSTRAPQKAARERRNDRCAAHTATTAQETTGEEPPPPISRRGNHNNIQANFFAPRELPRPLRQHTAGLQPALKRYGEAAANVPAGCQAVCCMGLGGILGTRRRWAQAAPQSEGLPCSSSLRSGLCARGAHGDLCLKVAVPCLTSGVLIVEVISAKVNTVDPQSQDPDCGRRGNPGVLEGGVQATGLRSNSRGLDPLSPSPMSPFQEAKHKKLLSFLCSVYCLYCGFLPHSYTDFHYLIKYRY